MKPEIRILGFDDCQFSKDRKGKTMVIGAVFRGGNFIDGVISTEVEVDGDDATERLVELIKKTKFQPQIRAIFLNGIAFGGFNVIDIETLYKKTSIPIVVIIRRMPDRENIKQILERIGKKDMIKSIDSAGEPVKIGKIFAQFKGAALDDVKALLKVSCTHSHIPEPLRVAHLIAQGIYFGESKGKA